MDVDSMDELKAIVAAIHCGDKEQLTSYIANGGDPNAQYGMTLLSQAIDAGQLEMVRLLLDAGSNPDFGGKSGRLPLYMAAKNQKPGSLAILKLLIERNADVNRKYINGNTPLLESVWLDDNDKAAMLIEAGADVLDYNNGGDTGLHMSAMKGNEKILKMFLDAGVPVDTAKHSRNPASLRYTGTHALHLTVVGPNGGYDRIAEQLLKARADPNAIERNSRTTLHLAAMRNAYRVVDVLLKYGADIKAVSMDNNEQKTPLMKAIDYGHHLVVDRLIAAGANLDTVDVYRTPPLIAAVYTGKPLVVKSLIQAGCDVNCMINGVTPFLASYGVTPFLASLNHTPHITEMLARAGCKLTPNVGLSSNRRLPVHDYPEVFTWLVDQSRAPGSLQQICRTTVRRALSHRPVKSLEQCGYVLPSRIKEYLNCKELEVVLSRYAAL